MLALLVGVVLVAGAALAVAGFRSTEDTSALPPGPGGRVPGSTGFVPPVEPLTTANTLSLDPVGVRAAIVNATVPNGVLTPPDDVRNVGIWLDGAPLDSATGTTLIVGHVNLIGQGNGALFELGSIHPGEVIRTSNATGTPTSWRVTTVESRPKAAGVEDSVLAGPDGPRRLAVVTCGGELQFDNGVGDYSHNTYLYAEPVV
ncbi:class F sortase [Prescottella equi]|uniref:class F sortase n=1 Tax=Rhodococcus hoagii TaxID=43767 RepID=UPI001F265198|nr:class F sortase [Prescottella equi]